METYGPKLKCVNLEASYNLLGNFNTELASNLMIVFERCDMKVSGNNCASDAEFKDWVTSKYLITLENEKRFVNHKFKKQSVATSSAIHWLGLSADSRLDLPKVLKRTHIERSDEPFDVAEFRTVEIDGFIIENQGTRALPYKN